MDSNVFDQFDAGASPSASPAPPSQPAIPVPDDSNPIASTPLTYEQFEAAKNNSGTPGASQVMNGPNPFDQFDDPAHPDNQVAATSRQPSLGTLVESPFVGFNEGAADMIGAPVDFANWGMKKLGLPIRSRPSWARIFSSNRWV